MGVRDMTMLVIMQSYVHASVRKYNAGQTTNREQTDEPECEQHRRVES